MKGSENMRKGSVDTMKGSENMRKGSADTMKGSENMRKGSEAARNGSEDAMGDSVRTQGTAGEMTCSGCGRHESRAETRRCR